MRAALSLLDLELFTVEVRTHISRADLDLDDAPEDDQDQFSDEE